MSEKPQMNPWLSKLISNSWLSGSQKRTLRRSAMAIGECVQKPYKQRPADIEIDEMVKAGILPMPDEEFLDNVLDSVAYRQRQRTEKLITRR